MVVYWNNEIQKSELCGASIVTILLVDDHPAIRKATRDMVESSDLRAKVLETGTVNGAKAALRKSCVDIVVFDLELPDGNGADLLQTAIPQRNNDCEPGHTISFVCLTMHADLRTITETISKGANGFLSKESAPEEVLVSIRCVAGGQSYMCPQTTRVITSWIQDDPRVLDSLEDTRYQKLSPKEKKVFHMLVDGYETAAVAEVLSINKKTVANYRLKIFSSLGVSTTRELRLYAEDYGLSRG